MKWLLLVVISAFAVFGSVKKNSFDKKENNSSRKTYSSFAVLELFTSEGCSSCPPADRLLPRLATANTNIIPLSFHVDYWDHLGWKDRFSDAEYSERQKAYARQLRLESIYTPQLIINGEYELVGSNRSTAEADINKALKEKSAVAVNIDEVKKENNKLLIGCSLTGSLNQAEVAAALVQRHAETEVKTGENGGARLTHTNVVRSFVQKAAKDKMQFEVEIPHDLNEDNLLFVVYTHEKKNLKITGVAVWEGRQ